jgi:hypothetical protein
MLFHVVEAAVTKAEADGGAGEHFGCRFPHSFAELRATGGDGAEVGRQCAAAQVDLEADSSRR